MLFDILHHSSLQLVYEIDNNGFAPVSNFYFMVMIVFFLSHKKHEHSNISSLLLFFFPRFFYSWGKNHSWILGAKPRAFDPWDIYNQKLYNNSKPLVPNFLGSAMNFQKIS